MQNLELKSFLEQHEREHQLPHQLAALLLDIADACKQVGREVAYGSLKGNMGNAASANSQGEQQKTLDVLSNDILLQHFQHHAAIAGLASEEMEHALVTGQENAPYLLLFDPLDGSSNVNLNLSVGSIFSVLPAVPGRAAQAEDFLQPGTRQQLAAYALYGTSTMLVFTLGFGVYGFTLNPDSGEFLLTHANMRIAVDTSEFAINMSNQRYWQPPVQRYIKDCLAGSTGPRGKDFNMRWVATMVAEVHRLLVRGGVFLYPLDSRSVGKGGRLRLLYEGNPMSWLVEQAGGQGSTGHRRILEVEPTSLHQRVAVVLGASREVGLVREYYSFTDPTA